MSNNEQLINNCLSNKDLKNIVKMLERLPIDVANTYKKYRSVMEYEYIKNTLDHNYNYSNRRYSRSTEWRSSFANQLRNTLKINAIG